MKSNSTEEQRHAYSRYWRAGGGKTTIARIIARTLRIWGLRVTFDDQDGKSLDMDVDAYTDSIGEVVKQRPAIAVVNGDADIIRAEAQRLEPPVSQPHAQRNVSHRFVLRPFSVELEVTNTALEPRSIKGFTKDNVLLPLAPNYQNIWFKTNVCGLGEAYIFGMTLMEGSAEVWLSARLTVAIPDPNWAEVFRLAGWKEDRKAKAKAQA